MMTPEEQAYEHFANAYRDLKDKETKHVKLAERKFSRYVATACLARNYIEKQINDASRDNNDHATMWKWRSQADAASKFLGNFRGDDDTSPEAARVTPERAALYATKAESDAFDKFEKVYVDWKQLEEKQIKKERDFFVKRIEGQIDQVLQYCQDNLQQAERDKDLTETRTWEDEIRVIEGLVHSMTVPPLPAPMVTPLDSHRRGPRSGVAAAKRIPAELLETFHDPEIWHIGAEEESGSEDGDNEDGTLLFDVGSVLRISKGSNINPVFAKNIDFVKITKRQILTKKYKNKYCSGQVGLRCKFCLGRCQGGLIIPKTLEDARLRMNGELVNVHWRKGQCKSLPAAVKAMIRPYQQRFDRIDETLKKYGMYNGMNARATPCILFDDEKELNGRLFRCD